MGDADGVASPSGTIFSGAGEAQSSCGGGGTSGSCWQEVSSTGTAEISGDMSPTPGEASDAASRCFSCRNSSASESLIRNPPSPWNPAVGSAAGGRSSFSSGRRSRVNAPWPRSGRGPEPAGASGSSGTVGSSGAGISASVSPMDGDDATTPPERNRLKARSTSSSPCAAPSTAGEEDSGAGKGIRFPSGDREDGRSTTESRTAEPRSKEPSSPGAGGAGASPLRTTMLSPHFRHFTRAPLPLILDSSRRNRAWHVLHSMIIPSLRKMVSRDVAPCFEL